MVPLVAAGCLQAVGVMAGIILGGRNSGGPSRPAKLRCRGRSGDARLQPILAPRLPLPIPVPLAMGVPAGGYPWKALIALAGTVDTDPVQAATARSEEHTSELQS